MPHKTINVQGRYFVLVPRRQLRGTRHGRFLSVPTHLPLVASQIPSPPQSWDGSKNRTIKYPVLGNDKYGDCYEADALHCVQTWTGNVGAQAQFDEAAAVREYLALSGGDNGLGDSQVFPHWKNPGFQGHKILDDMTVNPNDDNALRLGMYLFCGASYTAALPDEWLARPQPGQVWDVGMPDPANGHAMHLSGYDGQFYNDETWGFDPCIRLTPAGLKGSDPEVTVQFSLEMFNAQGVAPHNGMTYDALAALWVQLGGQQLPPSPFGPPAPTPTPTPPAPAPVPIAQIRAQIDAVFARAINAVRWWPQMVQVLILVQAQVDAVLAKNRTMASGTFSFSSALPPIPSQVISIINAAFDAAALAYPAQAGLITAAKLIVDQFLPLL
jgi:hypothetical protein